MATISPNLQEIRQHASLTQVIKEEQETETWMRHAYTELDTGREIWNMAKRKANGGDGIPGEDYKATRQWAIKPIKITKLIKEGKQIPQRWTDGTIVYI